MYISVLILLTYTGFILKHIKQKINKDNTTRENKLKHEYHNVYLASILS